VDHAHGVAVRKRHSAHAIDLHAVATAQRRAARLRMIELCVWAPPRTAEEDITIRHTVYINCMYVF